MILGRSGREKRAPDADLRGPQEELALAASRAPDVHRSLLVIVRRLCTLFEWEFGEAWVPSRDGSVLKPGPAWPRANPHYQEFRLRSRRLGFLPGGGLAGRVWSERTARWIEDLESVDPATFTRKGLALRTGFRSLAALPVRVGEEVVAVVVLYRMRPGPAEPGELERIASVLAPLGPVVARKRVEVELAVRERQQKAVARLGLHALSDSTVLETLLLEAARISADTLGVGHCKVLELTPGGEQLLLRAGVGWKAELIGKRTVPAGKGSQAGFTLLSAEPVLVTDLDREERFTASDLVREHGIVSGLSVIVHLHDGPYGVLSVHGRQRRSFTPDDVHFLQAVANVLGTTIERNRAEQELAGHRRHLEELVERRTEQLEASHERLRTAERLASIGTLAAGLGHDLGNTVLPLLCRLDSLESGAQSEAAREDLAAVRQAVEYLRQLSQGLRYFALDPEKSSAKTGVSRLRDWWLCVAPLLRSALPKRVELKCDLPAGLPPVGVPPHRLSQAVLNLVSNAAEAIHGEGLVRVWAEPDPDGSVVRLAVTDDGLGMPPEVRRHSLDPFFTTKKRGLSTGLGLALVHAVARSCGGEVEIESREGFGTTITLCLPAAEGDDAKPAPEPEPTVAAISLDDSRLAAYAELLIRSAGIDVALRPEGDPSNTHIWITDPSRERVGAARQYLAEDPRRRVVFFGELPGGSREPRFVVVDRAGGPDAMRRSLRQVVFQLLEATA